MSLNMKSFTQALAQNGSGHRKNRTNHRPRSNGSQTLARLRSPFTRSAQLDPVSLGSSILPRQRVAEDTFLDVIRADAARLVRIRHPEWFMLCRLLDENKNAMAMVTEPLFRVGNGLVRGEHGLLQIAESLDFLHNNAHLIHRAISPENILITSSGAWKLGGFGFAITTDQASGDLASSQAFHYAEYDDEDSMLPLQPSLNYTAPELVRSKAPSAGCSSDIFSFGCLAYQLIAHKPLFDCHNNVKMYMNTLNYLSSAAFSSIPPELVPDLQKMLSANESFRPNSYGFLQERDNMQKSEFLKALSEYVLPPLCAELRNMVMQPMILPMVLTIAESQDKIDFELSTLPALIPVLSTAAGETLLLLVKHAELVINKTSQDNLISHVLPLLVRAYDDTDPRIQEEVLRKSSFLAKQLDVQLVKQAILPRVHGLALKTTVAAVRVNALLCFGDLVSTLDKHAILDILQTIQRCTAVDRTPPTLMCTLGVANSILKQHGVEFVTEHVLPLLTPLLTAQQLNVQQFAKYMLFVKDILRMIEEKRGVTVTDSGIPEVKSSSFPNGIQPPASSKTSGTVAPAAKGSTSWDEDWGPVSKGSATAHRALASNSAPTPFISANQPVQLTFLQSESPMTSAVSSKQTAISCPPIDIEWPPRASSTVTQIDIGNKQMDAGATSTSSFNEIDPFADWPPRPSGISSGSGASNNGTTGLQPNSYSSNLITNTPDIMNFQNKGNISWAFNNQSSLDPLKPNQGTSAVNSGSLNSGPNPQSSIGFLKQNQNTSILGSYNNTKPTDLGSIFGSSKNEQTAIKLAPPPTSAVGRGRGRGRGGTSTLRSSHAKPQSEQPPLLDLL
ncbi:hypothetical protein D5086_024745 [Populus alba]|uniref:Uncharacterized protein n=1 Tax=Populus alba TaxID=43335 RepID=A0ACC4B7W6_POPAL